MNQSHSKTEIDLLKKQVEILQQENKLLKEQLDFSKITETVIVPDNFKEIFDQAEKNVADYFSDAYNLAENGEIVISGERYVLIRSASLSYEFLDIIKELYSNKGIEEAIRIGNNFLFDIGHVLGKKDAKAFHKRMKLTDPIQKLSAGPVHFAYTGWANVEILTESNPSPDQNFFLKYHHHNSFEAQSWIKAKRASDKPVCTMNSGYSSGWCEESFGIPLTAVEISCEACGDENCTFIMAPPNKINEYLEEIKNVNKNESYEVPVFFKRKIVEDKLRKSLKEKETLLKEVHHRVKNNLQIISSLFNLQLDNIKNDGLKEIFKASINRVKIMAQIHELIYTDKNIAIINIQDYIQHLMISLSQFYYTQSKNITVDYTFDLKDRILNTDMAVPFGLLLNELASNSFKFINSENGKITIDLKDDVSFFYLKFSDNGSGLPKNISENTLGIALIDILSEQLDGSLQVDSSDKGVTYSIKFKK